MNENSASLAIHAQGVHKNYLSNHVLRGFDLAVPAGKSFGCAGVNGAGKSTFLKCLLDFCYYTAGTISIFGEPSAKYSSRMRLGFLPERFYPPYYLNGRQFIKFVLSLNRAEYQEQKTIAMLEALDLDLDTLKKPVRLFSKGMTQKLGLASVFLLERELYILDEPMSGLDPKARALLKRKLKEIHTVGSTIFFTSHSLSDIEEVCEEMAVLHGGRVCFTGKPQTLLGERGGSDSLEEAFLKIIAEEPAVAVEQTA